MDSSDQVNDISVDANTNVNNTSQTTNPADEKTIKETLEFLNTDILKLMGAEKMPPEQQDRIYKKMMDTIHNRVLASLLDSLSDEQYEEFKKILDADDQDALADFAEKTNINLPQLYAEEAVLYKIEMVNLIKSSSPAGDDK